jgi:hypothetical protein
MGIKRYDNDEGASEMYECDDGQFVLYEDHIKIVEELNRKVQEAYWRGRDEGKYNWRL